MNIFISRNDVRLIKIVGQMLYDLNLREKEKLPYIMDRQ